MADEIVDTSDMTVHELRQFFMGLSRDRARARLVVTRAELRLQARRAGRRRPGVRRPLPAEPALRADAAAAHRPRPRGGARSWSATPSTREFIERLEDYLRFVLPYYVAEGKSYLTVAIGCTGGRHRSVMIAERLRRGARRSVDRAAQRAGPASRHPCRAEPDMIGVVVVTHGQLATELVNAAEMIVGDLPQFTAVSIGWHDEVNDAREDIAQAIERVRGDGGVLLLTDMFGGTPSNLGMTFLETDRLEVITGVNLPMLIKLASLRSSPDLLAVAREMRDHGRNAIWVASDLLRGEKALSSVMTSRP